MASMRGRAPKPSRQRPPSRAPPTTRTKARGSPDPSGLPAESQGSGGAVPQPTQGGFPRSQARTAYVRACVRPPAGRRCAVWACVRGKVSCNPALPSEFGLGSERLRVLFVRSARIEDVEAMALIMAALAEEGLIATEPPVDLEAQARRFRKVIEAESPTAAWWVEDAGRVVGNAGVHERGSGVLYLGMGILSMPVLVGHTNSSWRHGSTTRARSLFTPRLDSRSKACGATTTAAATGACGVRCSWLDCYRQTKRRGSLEARLAGGRSWSLVAVQPRSGSAY
jgi:hypothetical protein